MKLGKDLHLHPVQKACFSEEGSVNCVKRKNLVNLDNTRYKMDKKQGTLGDRV